MTGNVTGFLVELVAPGPPEARAKHTTTGLVLAGFSAGCAAGGFGVAHAGFGILVVPAIVLGLMLLRLPA